MSIWIRYLRLLGDFAVNPALGKLLIMYTTRLHKTFSLNKINKIVF